MIVADHAADVLGLGDVAGLEAEHAHDGVAGRGRDGRVLLELAGDVLAEVVGRPVGEVGPDDRQPRWQQLGLGQLGDRGQQQAAGQITGGSEQDHALDHVVTAFSARRGRHSQRGDGRPVTPGRQRKIAPASGSSARCSQSTHEVVM